VAKPLDFFFAEERNLNDAHCDSDTSDTFHDCPLSASRYVFESLRLCAFAPLRLSAPLAIDCGHRWQARLIPVCAHRSITGYFSLMPRHQRLNTTGTNSTVAKDALRTMGSSTLAF